MVLAALRSDFSVDRVAQELRNQWSDDDVRRRDQGGRVSAWSVDMECEEENPLDQSPDWATLAQSGINDEGLAIIHEAEDDAQDALFQMEKNKRTLREARRKQHVVKMSRQFYRSSRPPFSRPRGQAPREGAPANQMTCLACGGPHRTSQCPKKTTSTSGAANVATDADAPFVCLTQEPTMNEACVVDGRVSTREAVEQGKAIIDGGATRTLGSVLAVEKVMTLNQHLHGTDGICRVDDEDRPTFGFSNSSTDKCLSTAWLRIAAGGQPGQLKVHTLDKGSGPILFSIETLRSLGAVIDYENDLAVFRSLDPKKIIELERSCTGHQLLPLTEDWFKKAQSVSDPVPSLKQYI